MNQQILLASRPAGEPTLANFRLASVPRAEPGPGEALLETLWLSLDPYMRLRMEGRASYAAPVAIGGPMQGEVVARVLQSRDPALAVGELVAGRTGWQSHPVAPVAQLRRVAGDANSSRRALGILGMPSLTAYCGLLDIGQPKAGETVVVGAATGAVGSIVGQIAKIHGCRVVGIAGGAAKCTLAVTDQGFDACLDHREPALAERLAAACPNGIDVYFENVGGAVLAAVLPLLNVFARVPLCGLVSQYNRVDEQHGQDVVAATALPLFLEQILTRRLTVRGFIISDMANRRPAFEADMTRWIDDGRIHYREDITDGLAQAPAAFLRMLRGGNVGKTLVRVA